MKMRPYVQHPQRDVDYSVGRARGSVFEMFFVGVSDIGLRREANEDAYLMLGEDGLFVIADGVGGHAAGEVASRLTCDLIGAYYRETAGMEVEEMPVPYALDDEMLDADRRLVTAVKLANAAVYEQGAERVDQRGMGSTVVAVHVEADKIHWAHVGDSRLYRLRYGRMMQLTSDHTMLNHIVEQEGLKGEELEEFVRNFPHKNTLVRAVGIRRSVEVEWGSASLEDGDVFLLCTDGVHNMMRDVELGSILVEQLDDLGAAGKKIVAGAIERGGLDNITAVMVDVRQISRDKALH